MYLLHRKGPCICKENDGNNTIRPKTSDETSNYETDTSGNYSHSAALSEDLWVCSKILEYQHYKSYECKLS